MTKEFRKVGRDAKTGKFVKLSETETHPETTVVERFKNYVTGLFKRKKADDQQDQG